MGNGRATYLASIGLRYVPILTGAFIMAANSINFVNELIYGDMGNAELGASAPPFRQVN